MIKRYNQFVKENKTNEEYEYSTEVDTPSLPALGQRAEATPSEAPLMDEMPEEMTGEVEEVGVDKYTDALQKLADAAGVEYNSVEKSVVINDKKVTFPTETEKYHVEGVKKPFATLEEVLAYFENGVSPQARQEVRDEMSSIADEEVLDRQEQFESKSYKSKRLKK
jgi:hypothetical protein